MILVFTYHVVDGTDGKRARDFYTVQTEQMERHCDALAATGGRGISCASLRQANSPAGGDFILTFDDATADHATTVAPLLARRGWTAAFFVPTAKLNQPGYLTDAQVRELAQAGHDIGFHSHEHRRLDLAPDDQMREQISRSQQIIGDLIGERPRLFAPPGGFMNEHLREVALGFGVEVIRTMRWGYNRTLDLTALETVPINRHTDDAKFQKILQIRRTNCMYFGKQAMKALVPTRTYERMRNLLFKLARRN
jgi:peptidoglycan/xylan/chitin deacetylase (PgdA/CDA1 family)